MSIVIPAHLKNIRRRRKRSDRSTAIERDHGRQKKGAVQGRHLGIIACAVIKTIAIKDIKAEEAIEDKQFQKCKARRITRLTFEAIRAGARLLTV